MGISLSDLMFDERTIPVVVGKDPETGEEQVLQVTYKPSSLTPALEQSAAQISGRMGLGPGVATMLSGLLVDWDLEISPGVVLSPAYDPNDPGSGMGLVPDQVLFKIRDAIILDLRQSKETLKNSGGGSRRAGKSGPARIGTPLSKRRSSLA